MIEGTREFDRIELLTAHRAEQDEANCVHVVFVSRSGRSSHA